MILYEYEGKALLSKVGFSVPPSQLLSNPNQEITLKPPFVLKAQVLSGKRAKEGGIVKIKSLGGVRKYLEELFKKTINGEGVEKVLLEEMIEFDKEFYVSLSYSPDSRQPTLTLCEEGGSGVESKEVIFFPINPLDPLGNLPDLIDREVLKQLIGLFFKEDCLLLEINPLVKAKSGIWFALDAKIKLDDDAKFRHPDWQFSPRLVAGHAPTPNELAAKKVDEGDHRGTAGSAFFDMDGDIAVLSSGGGVSLTAMDALVSSGGKPANFTEYSGNPPKEKVLALSRIVLSKPNLHGLWVIGTVAANFTDIYETLSGIIEALTELRVEGLPLDFPIVIRRGGPREEEAFQMLKKHPEFNFIVQGEEVSIAQSARIMAEQAKKYATTSR